MANKDDGFWRCCETICTDLVKLCKNLEYLLRHGVDIDVVLLIGDDTNESKARGLRPVPDTSAVFYVELCHVLALIEPPPPNLSVVQSLLGTTAADRLWTAATSALSLFAPRPQKDNLPVWHRHKPANLAGWSHGKLHFCGVMTSQETYYGAAALYYT